MKQINLYGQTINCPTMPEFWDAAASGKWEQFTFACIDEYVKPGTSFVDIGAWNGVLSVYASKLGANVYSVEPDIIAAQHFKKLIEVNETHLHFYPVAISGSEGKATFYSSILGNSESSIVNREGVKESYQVDTITLEMLVDDIEDISLIKIDIEGGEKLALPQAKEWIEANRPPLHISFHPAWLGDLDAFIGSIAYLFDIYTVYSDGGTLTNKANFRQVLNSHQHAFIFRP
jgi:FkbM family methyltransferase